MVSRVVYCAESNAAIDMINICNRDVNFNGWS